jgi:hypothetical protein
MLATFLNLTRNGEQRFQFVGDFRGGVIAFDAINQIVISPRMFRCCSSVRQLAETAIVLRRNVVCDHFALSRGSKCSGHERERPRVRAKPGCFPH